jgi:phosphonate dehydrogenase
VVSNPSCDALDENALRSAARDAWGILAFMPDRVDQSLLDTCPGLRIVACALKGFDNFDVEACTNRGVWLTIVPDLLTEPTAELAIGLAIALCRHVLPADLHIRNGRFTGWRPSFYGRSLDGSRVAIVGCGRVGHAIARKLAGFACELLMTDSHPEAPAAGHARRVDPVTALRHADVVFLAVPLIPSTLKMVNAAWLAQLPRGALLINPARGSVVDEAAIADALESGQLGGYAADVFEFEDWAVADRPASIEPRLLALTDRTLFTPHIGSAVEVVRRQIELDAAHNLIEVLDGKRPHGAINELRS